MTREGYGPCEVCGTPTRAMAWDMFMCDACQDTMADELTAEARVRPENVAPWIAEARERIEEAGSDRRQENWRQW